MSALLIHKFEIGDRVKATSNLGWLKMDTIGIVTSVHDKDSTHDDATFRDEEETLIVAWPRSAYADGAIKDGFNPWDGTIMGIGQIDIYDIEKPAYELPMRRAEVTFIDNLIK